MNVAAVESWIEAPLRRFIDDARARLAVLLHPSGQVMAQAGFTREVDVMAACALAAAAFATSGELGRRLDGRAFRGLHFAGATRQLFLSALETPRGTFVCLTVFDDASSLGLVRLYFEEMRRELISVAPASTVLSRPTPTLAADFETELNRNLAALFSGAKAEAVIS
jgi:hypothetical protein